LLLLLLLLSLPLLLSSLLLLLLWCGCQNYCVAGGREWICSTSPPRETPKQSDTTCLFF